MLFTRLRLACVVAVLCAVPAVFVRAQDDSGRFYASKISQSAVPVAAPATVAAPAAVPLAAPPVYLPLLSVRPDVNVQFSGNNSAQCEPFVPAANFGYGIKYLCYDILITGGKGQTYRTEWVIDGKPQNGLNESGTVLANQEIEGGYICFGPGGACGDAVPRGTYLVKVYLDDILYQQVAVVIS